MQIYSWVLWCGVPETYMGVEQQAMAGRHPASPAAKLVAIGCITLAGCV